MADKNPPSTTPAQDDVMQRIELLISRMLFYGVVTSMATVLLGVVFTFIHHPDYLRSAVDLHRLVTPGAALPHTLGDVAVGIVAGHGQAVVTLGLILLIATPIMRVAVAMVGFALQRDRAYMIISAVVLAVLAISFFLGKVE
jgi:uncharacterized membrane protein